MRTATEVAPRTLTAPVAVDTLARTGGGATAALTHLGTWTLGLGTLALLAGRRRR